MNGETLMKDDSKESIKIRESCIEILNTYAKKVSNEIQRIQEKSKESKKQKSEFILAKHKIDTQYDANNTLFSPHEKNMRQKEEDKLTMLLSQVEDSEASYDQEILEQQDHLKKVNLLRECIESIETDTQSILRIQDLERKRIADDLQELIIHDLNRLIEKSESCSKVCSRYPNKGRQGLNEISSCLKKITNIIKSMISSLYPVNIGDIGLVPAIESYIKGIEKTYGVSFHLEIEEEGHNTNDIRDLMMFRIIQEVCHQITMHSKAGMCMITLKYVDYKALLTIEENGTEVNFANDSNLSSIKEIIFLLSGEYEVSSVGKESTKLSISIPLKKAEI